MSSGHQQHRTDDDRPTAGARRSRPVAAVDAVRALGCADPVAALVHLLTPREVILGVDTHLSGATFRFRGLTCPLDAADLPATASCVWDLVTRTLHDGDTFCDLDAEPATWLNPTRSGAHVLLLGASELFGLPLVRVQEAVASDEVLSRVSAAVSSGSRLPLRLDGLVVCSSREVVAISAPTSQAHFIGSAEQAALVVEAAGACGEVADLLGAVRQRWVPQPTPFPYTVNVTGDLELPDGAILEVPLTQTQGGRLAGVPLEEMVLGVSGTGVPHGYVPAGLRLRDGLTVVEHPGTGVRAALKRRPTR